MAEAQQSAPAKPEEGKDKAPAPKTADAAGGSSGGGKGSSSTGTGDGFWKSKTFRVTVLLLVGIIVAAFVGVILSQLIKEPDLFGKLRDAAYARGVITFLVVLASIGLCYILVTHSLFGEDDDKGDHFRRAREVLGVLTGIMGTIVGFYFGTTEKAGTELQVAEIQTEVQSAGGTNTWELATFVTGGTPPYRYNLTFALGKDAKGSTPANVTNKLSDNGWIKAKLAATNAINVAVEVVDKSDRRKTVKAELATPKP